MISLRAKRLLTLIFIISEKSCIAPYSWDSRKCRPEVTTKKFKFVGWILCIFLSLFYYSFVAYQLLFARHQISIIVFLLGVNLLSIGVAFVVSQIAMFIHLRDLPWLLDQCFILEKEFKRFDNRFKLKRKSMERDQLSFFISAAMISFPLVLIAAFTFFVLNPKFIFLLSSVISLPENYNYVVSLTSAIYATFVLFVVVGNWFIWSFIYGTYAIAVNQILDNLLLRSGYRTCVTFYRKLKILEIYVNDVFSSLAFVAQVTVVVDIVSAIFIVITSSDILVTAMKVISGFIDILTMLIGLKVSAGLYEKSIVQLSLWTKTYRQFPMIRRIQRSLQPLYVSMCGLYFVDKGLTYTVLEIILRQSIDLLLMYRY
ncbi:unnamed protein product [Allacma fusca]|uniref:Uncharacterized protein n=1 Tax=Allacma fusca TaxID=39272 RepID=A0A8J2L231_9HEXA|nr:unnamed protein product [Allacma fusca]